jgi:ribosome-associated translation inhibitor RaiA
VSRDFAKYGCLESYELRNKERTIMQIQVNTDSHIKGSAKLTHEVKAVVERALRRFGDRITRVHVHLSDQNSGDKYGDDDKRCVIEARLARLRPITASHRSASLEQAVDGAADTLQEALTRIVTRKHTLFKRRARAQAALAAGDSLFERDATVVDYQES